MSEPIEAGRTYWVTFEGARLQVRAVQLSKAMPGWWDCESCVTRRRMSFPATAKWELDPDAPPDGA